MTADLRSYSENIYPASFIQMQFWIIQSINPDSPAYNQPSVCMISGKIDINALETAYNTLVRRYPLFRSVFYIDNSGVLVQQVLPWNKIDLPIDTIQHSMEDTSGEITKSKQILTEVRKPFKLETGPPLRIKFFKINEQSYALVINAHHIVFDQVTKDMFSDELSKEYSKVLSGKTGIEIAEVKDYANFSVSQQAWIEGDEFDKIGESWLRFLDGADFSLKLPVAEQSGKEQALPNAVNPLPVRLPDQITSLVQKYSKKENVTPFLVMLTAWSLTIARYSGKTKLCIGIPMTNRRADEFKQTMGCFVNILPMPLDISDNPTFRESLRRVRMNILQMHRMQEMPYYSLVQLLRQKNLISENTLFQTGFTFEHPMVLHLEGLDVKPIYIHPGGAQLDLFTTFWQGLDSIVGVIKYDESKYDSNTVKNIRDNFLEIITAVCDSPDDNIERVTGSLIKKQETEFREKKDIIDHAEVSGVTAISASFTAEVFQEFFEFWYEKFAWNNELRFASFNQVFQELLNPLSLLCSNKKGNNIVLVRLDDLIDIDHEKDSRNSADFQTRLSSLLDELLHAVKTATRAMSVPLCFVLCPSSPENESLLKRETGGLNDFIENMRAIPGVTVITHNDIVRKYPVKEYYEPYGEEIGHVPFTRPYLAALATTIVRSLHTLIVKPVKAIAVDCDRTIWEGVSAEDGALKVAIGPVQQDFQKFLLEQYQSGVVLALCSKNQENDVWAVFESHPGMLLTRNHFTFWKINWEPKSSNIQLLAKEINIGLNAIAFLDDSPIERAEVGLACPSVLCVEFPDAWEARTNWLEHFWALDHSRITAEDLKRQEHYRSEQLRESIKRSAGSLQDFLEKLELKIEIHSAEPSDYERLSQLSIRTNQFNTTTLKVTPQEVAEYSKTSGLYAHVARVSDKFGDYGLVGGMLARKEGAVLVIEGLFLSCRALGRGVEYRIASYLASIARNAECETVLFPVKTTERNEPARKFLDNVMSYCNGIVEKGDAVKVTTERLLEIHYEPRQTQDETEDKATTEVPAGLVNSTKRDSSIYCHIADELNSAESILAAVENRNAQQPNKVIKDIIHLPEAPPETKTEQIIADIWKHILKLNSVNRRAKFFEVGGTSLLMVRVAVELKNNYGIEATVTDMFQYPTIEGLAGFLDNKEKAVKNTDQIEKTGINQRKALKTNNLAASFNRLKSSRTKDRLSPE